MTVVKFVFRKDIGTEDFCEDRDIPAWRQLNKISMNLLKKLRIPCRLFLTKIKVLLGKMLGKFYYFYSLLFPMKIPNADTTLTGRFIILVLPEVPPITCSDSYL
jgi:hypothetical protein